MKLKDFGEDYVYLQTDYDVEMMLEFKTEKKFMGRMFTGVLVKYQEDEIVEIYGTYSNTPYVDSADYERVEDYE